MHVCVNGGSGGGAEERHERRRGPDAKAEGARPREIRHSRDETIVLCFLDFARVRFAFAYCIFWFHRFVTAYTRHHPHPTARPAHQARPPHPSASLVRHVKSAARAARTFTERLHAVPHGLTCFRTPVRPFPPVARLATARVTAEALFTPSTKSAHCPHVRGSAQAA